MRGGLSGGWRLRDFSNRSWGAPPDPRWSGGAVPRVFSAASSLWTKRGQSELRRLMRLKASKGLSTEAPGSWCSARTFS